MCLGEAEVLTSCSGLEPWEEALPGIDLMHYFDCKPLHFGSAAPAGSCRERAYSAATYATRKEGLRKVVSSKGGVVPSTRPKYSPMCYQTGLQTIRILQGKCHSLYNAEKLGKQSSDFLRDSKKKTVANCALDGPAVPFNDNLWSVLLMHPSCVRFLEKLTLSSQVEDTRRLDQSQVDGINRQDKTQNPQQQILSLERLEAVTKRKTPVLAEALEAEKQAFPLNPSTLNPVSESLEIASTSIEPGNLEVPDGCANTVNGQTSAKKLVGQIGTPLKVVNSDSSSSSTAPSGVGNNATDMAHLGADVKRELEAHDPQSSPTKFENPGMVESPSASTRQDSKNTRDSIQFDDQKSDNPVLQALGGIADPELVSDGSSASTEVNKSTDNTEASLRRVGVFVAALACAVVGVFDPSRVNIVESAPTSEPNQSYRSAASTSSQGGGSKEGSNSRGQQSTSTGGNSSAPSTMGSSGGGLRGGGSGGSGGGGGGSDGDDNWGKLPDEPSDGFNPSDPRGITIVVAAVSLIGATLVHFFRRRKSNRQEIVVAEEEEAAESNKPEEIVHNDLRGGGNTSIELPEPLRDLQDKQVALCVSPGVQEQMLLVHGDPTSCTVVSPSPSVHNEPENEQQEAEELDVKHCTSRGISLAQLNPRSSEADDEEMTTKFEKPKYLEKHAVDSSHQVPQNDDLKAENAELLATVANLMEKLRRADARRKDAANELAYRRASFSTSEADLKGRLLGQEEQNTQIQKRFSAVDQERLSLVSTVKDAQAALSAVHPRLSQTLDEVERLSKVMRDQKKELSRLKLELGNATHDQGVVHRKMQNKEWEMEEINQLIVTMVEIENTLNANEKGKGFEEMLNHISAGLKVLRGLERRSKPARQIVSSLQGILLKLREFIFNSYTGVEQTEKTESALKIAAVEKEQLQAQLDEIEKNSRDLVTERDVLKTTVQMLKNSFQEKTLILEEIKLKQDSSEAVIARGEAERKHLVDELDRTRSELKESLATMDAAQRYSDEINAQAEELKEEKRSLQTQMKGLRLRIEQFEIEAQRLHSESEGLRTNLHQETAKCEGLESLSQEMRQSNAQMLSDHKQQVESLQEGLIAAEVKITELREEQANLEAAKKELQDAYDLDTQELKNQIQHLQDQAIEVARQNAQVSGAEELTRIMESAKEKGLKVETGASAPSYTSYTRPAPQEHPVADPMGRNDSMVLAWMENAAVEHPAGGLASSVQGGTRQLDSAIMTGTTEEIVPQKHPPRERRASWPQDMSTMISDHMFGAAQEVVQLTGTQLEISREKDAVANELKEANTKITETVAKLEEKDAAMCDLTEHFLQVYQIASNLATENDSAMLEIKEAKILSENLRVQIHQKEERIGELEGYFNSRMLAHRVEMDAEQDRHGDFEYSMATPRSVASVGTRSRSALPRAPSRTMSTISRVPSHEPMPAREPQRRVSSPSPTSISHIPEAPSSDASFRHLPRQSDSFEQAGLLSESLAAEPESKEAPPAPQPKPTAPYPKSRTSLKRISSAVSLRNRTGGFQ